MILGSFASEKDLKRAVDALRNEGLGPVETHTPAPPEEQRSGLKLVMLIAGFFFATVSGYLVGVIGSSNNPISGLTLSTLVIAALLMVSMGVSGTSGVLAVLGVAAVVCVSSAVAGELLQDFKCGYILGGTPRNIQIAELIAVVVASLIMYFPLVLLHEGNIRAGGTGFGDRQLPAPQAVPQPLAPANPPAPKPRIPTANRLAHSGPSQTYGEQMDMSD